MRASGRNDFGLVRREPVAPAVHLGFEAPDRAAVDAFHARGARGRRAGQRGSGLRPDYGPSYYAAFVIGPDGNNVEAVTQKPE